MRRLLILVVLLLPSMVLAQTYLERAQMGVSIDFIARVGVAAQGQAILAEGENPDTCCQTTTQIEMVGRKGVVISLCDIVRPSGKPNAPDGVKLLSRDRHTARQRFNRQVIANARDWASRIAPIVASDTCIPLNVTDVALTAYLVRLWDVMALPPELANEAFVPETPEPPPAPPPGLLQLPPPPPPVRKPPGGQP